MPIYDYKCEECNTKKTITRGMDENDKEYNCDTCNSKLVRVYSMVGVAFKGSGFYSTDK